MINNKKIALLIVYIIPFLSFSYLYGEILDFNKSSKIYRTKQLGDKAFNDGLYELAAKFYLTYQSESKSDSDAQIDAAESLIAAFVRSGNTLSASDVFNDLTTTFATTISKNELLRNRLTYWDGNIQMVAGNLIKASEIFSKLLNTLQQNSELYYLTLDALGTSQARDLKWDKAEKSYALLEFAGKGTKWQKIAIKKRLFALIMSKNYERAKIVMKTLPKEKNSYLLIIKNLILVKRNKFIDAGKLYRSIRTYGKGGDPLWFLLASSLANNSLKNKDYKSELFFLNDSLLFADSEFDRQQTLISIINAAVADRNLSAAVRTAEKFLKNYPESFISNEIRLRLANLYKDDKKTDDALQVYETVIKDLHASDDLKIKSARSAAQIFIIKKKYEEAREKFAYIAKEAKDSKTEGEGMYRMAELLYIQNKYKEASAAFGEVVKKYPSWSEKALFMQIDSLMHSKMYNIAIAKIDIFFKKYPKSEKSANLFFIYALALENDKKFIKAIKQYSLFSEKYPNHVYAPQALLKEGELSLKYGVTEHAIIAYTQLLKQYPEHDRIENTFYRRMYASFWKGDFAEALLDANILFSKYPKSKYALYASYRVADYFVTINHPNKAIGTFELILKNYSNNDKISSEILYEIANIYFIFENYKKALLILDDLSEKYPNMDIIGDALFLRGDLFAKQSEYEKAIPFFKKAATSAPNSFLECASWGRIADSYFALGWKTPDGTNYLKAVNFYNMLLNKKDLSSQFRDQSLYKLGRCEELLGDSGRALSKFHEAIYNYELDREEDRFTAKNSKWFVKSALAAARLYLAKDTPEAAEAAIVLYKTLIKLKIQPVDDFKKKIVEISQKYKLTE